MGKNQTVVGFDPGPDLTAWATFDGTSICAHGIYPTSTMFNADIGFMPLPNGIPAFVEMVACYGMAVGASVFETCVVIGKLELLGEMQGKPVTRVFRRDVKLHLCNSVRAKDANVRQALIDRIGPQGTKSKPGPTYGVRSHEWAALAVAVYGWDLLAKKDELAAEVAKRERAEEDLLRLEREIKEVSDNP